jgi:hypothetical protein
MELAARRIPSRESGHQKRTVRVSWLRTHIGLDSGMDVVDTGPVHVAFAAVGLISAWIEQLDLVLCGYSAEREAPENPI